MWSKAMILDHRGRTSTEYLEFGLQNTGQILGS